MTTRSVVTASNYEAWPEAFNGQAFAFLNVIRQLEDTDIHVPAGLEHTKGRGVHPTLRYLRKELFHRLSSAAWTRLGGAPLANAVPSPIERDHDLFFYMCQFPAELGTLGALKHWRRRAHCAVAYLLETWPELLASQRSQLRVLNDFDHVFLLNASCVEPMRDLIRTPVSFLPSACDTLLATPLPRPPERSIDVLSIGRRQAAAHGELLRHAAQHPDFFYVHDVVKGGAVLDWAAHRLQSAAMIKRAKFFLAFDFDVDRGGHFKGVRKRALATRYFEGAAGGAAVLGSRQQCPEFDACFDWQDAVFEVPAGCDRIGEFIAELSTQQRRLERARLMGISQSLRRHDWAYRWAAILDTVGMRPTARMNERLDTLGGLARIAEQALQPEEAKEMGLTA